VPRLQATLSGTGKGRQPLLEQRNKKSISDTNQEQIGDSSKWWFETYTSEDSIKMSIKLYRAKTQNWQDEYRFKCDNTYKYVLDRGFSKDEMEAIRMIGAIQISKQRKKNYDLNY
jgi:hypothetical protein